MGRFIIIGERIHCISPVIREAMNTMNPEPILKRAKEQLDAFEASRTELERAQQEIAARTEAFRKAWENLWDRNEAERAQVLARLQARLPEKSAYKGEKDLPAAVKGDLEQIAGWLALVQEEIQLGVTASEEMLERSANS